jgi:hypothetical protein
MDQQRRQQQQQQQQPQQQQQNINNSQQESEKQNEFFDETARQRINHMDVRMKRHPELQPYVPSDRFTTISTGHTLLNSNNKINHHTSGGGGSSLSASRFYNSNNKINHHTSAGGRNLSANRHYNSNKSGPKTTSSSMTTSSTANSSTGMPKKYCSMSRLNQLAQPKRRPATASNNTSSNQSNQSNNSKELETSTKTNKNDITRDITEPSIVEQVSEMSVNDPFYQSASSELVPDSENSTNDINYDRNSESLCREFEQDLIAKGIVKVAGEAEDEFRSPMSNGKDDSLRRSSGATIETSDNPSRPTGESPQARDEEDRRLKIEKELREIAERENDDRKKREELVESILSRFNQGSVS